MPNKLSSRNNLLDLTKGLPGKMNLRERLNENMGSLMIEVSRYVHGEFSTDKNTYVRALVFPSFSDTPFTEPFYLGIPSSVFDNLEDAPNEFTKPA